jgi:hypothetical protein
MVERLKLEAADPWDDLATQAPSHFEALHTGKPAFPPTPLYRNEGLTPDAILERWVQQLKPYETKYPKTIAYDLSRVSKFGPRGGYPPWSVMKQVLPLYASRLQKIDFSCKLVRQAILETQKFLKLDKQLNRRPLALDDAISRILSDMEASFKQSGVSSYGNKRDPEVIRRAKVLAQDREKALQLPFTLAERTQRINRDKVGGGARFIFMIAYALEMEQKKFFYPLFDYIRSLKLPEYAAWEGFEDVERFPLEKRDADDVFVSCDFTGMDQTCGPDQTELFFEITKNFFQRKFWDEYHAVLMAGVKNPVMVELNRAWNPGPHGTTSGESFTNLKETVDNTCGHILAMILQQKRHQHQDDGDDSCAVGDENLVEHLSKAFAMLGFELNPDKQDVSQTDYHYLQRFFCPDELGADGAYPTILALNACVYPERFHNPSKWGPRMETLRWIMILENCKHHPAFHDLIEFVRAGDKYGLNLGPNPEELYSQAKSLSGFVPSYNQASKDRKLMDFEVMKYLASHR